MGGLNGPAHCGKPNGKSSKKEDKDNLEHNEFTELPFANYERIMQI